jgi:hypothetical protein
VALQPPGKLFAFKDLALGLVNLPKKGSSRLGKVAAASMAERARTLNGIIDAAPKLSTAEKRLYAVSCGI